MQTTIKTFIAFGLCVCVLAGAAGAAGAATKINLGGRKDKVIHPDIRGDVLAVADLYLSKHDDGEFDELLVELQNPYTFEKKRDEEEEPEEVVEKVEPVKPKVRVVYDQGAVLKLVAKSFAKQIRGTMGMGDTYYIQLQKGGLMKAGTQFPARVPEARKEPFMITLAEVDDDSFSLQLDDVVRSFPFEDEKLSKGSIQIDED